MNMSSLEFVQEGAYEACQKEKKKWSSQRSKIEKSINETLQLIHIDLFGQVNEISGMISLGIFRLNFYTLNMRYHIHPLYMSNSFLIVTQ